MAHKKGVGSSRNGRESHSKRLGIKIYGGQKVIAGNIIVRQRGTKHYPGDNVGIGKDHTLFALIEGTVVFRKKANEKSFVYVFPLDDSSVATSTKRVAKDAGKDIGMTAKPEKSTFDAAAAKEAFGKKVTADDLKMIEGIGPKIEELFHDDGIFTWVELANTPVEICKEILAKGGSQYHAHDPSTWPQQAKLASEGKWAELKEWQDKLDGGK